MDNLLDEFNTRMDQVLRNANGRKIIIWGFGYSGRFLVHYLKRKNRIVDYIIDDNLSFPEKMHVFKSTILEELDERDCFVICCFDEEGAAEEILNERGYIKDKSYVWMKEKLGKDYTDKICYYSWLDYYYGTDIGEPKYNQSGDNVFYSYGSDYALVDVLDNFVISGEAIFDYGVGKGGTLIMFYDRGATKVGGCEIDKELCDIAKENLKKCRLNDAEILNIGAELIREEIDTYSIFHMYNPFGGNVFRKTIDNIEESFRRKPRKIMLIYSGVSQHKEVVRNGLFRLTKKIFNDYWSGFTNVYSIDLQ